MPLLYTLRGRWTSILLTITTTYQPATDLGYLLHKNPAKVQSFGLSFGRAHVFYPEASTERCTIALLLEVDPVHLVREAKGAGSVEQYVNDRPYVASSLLSVALAEVFGTALAGRCNARPELVEEALPLQVKLAAVPCRGGEDFLRRLFEPLGYRVEATALPLDENWPDWGLSSYYTVTLETSARLQEVLTHLYVLIPVLDDDKHYWIGEDELEKLLRRGKNWLERHPEREEIARRYLKRRRDLAREAIARLVVEEPEGEKETQEEQSPEEAAAEKPISLHQQRLDAVLEVLRESKARTVLDLGCGEGRLLQLLLHDQRFEKIAGMDVSYRALERAGQRLHLDRLPPRQRERITLLHGALTYRDRRLEGYDAAALVEVIEHLDPPRLAAFERVLFEFARPETVVLTTPNIEYNVRFETMPAGRLRHKDHRFEWTRAELQAWAQGVAARHRYTVEFRSVGPEDPEVGAPSQLALFTRS